VELEATVELIQVVVVAVVNKYLLRAEMAVPELLL
jgi:hypothetical protein